MVLGPFLLVLGFRVAGLGCQVFGSEVRVSDRGAYQPLGSNNNMFTENRENTIRNLNQNSQWRSVSEVRVQAVGLLFSD